MNKKGIAVAVVVMFGAVSGAMASGSMEGLSGAGEKLSAIEMTKESGKAGNVLDNFFSGSLSKKASAPAEEGVAAGPAAKAGEAKNIYGQTAKELCNARTAPVKLGAEVKPLSSAIAKTGLAETARYGVSNWVDDFNTVTDYVGHVGTHAGETWGALTDNPVDPDEVGIVHGVINTLDAALNP